MADVSGNRNVTKDFLRIFQVFERKVMKDLVVGELARIKGHNADGTYYCELLSKDNVGLTCIAVDTLDGNLYNGDIVVLIFLDRDYKKNLKRIDSGTNTQQCSEDDPLHSYQYGIIIGRVRGGL